MDWCKWKKRKPIGLKDVLKALGDKYNNNGNDKEKKMCCYSWK